VTEAPPANFKGLDADDTQMKKGLEFVRSMWFDPSVKPR